MLEALPGCRPCALGKPGAPLTAPKPQVAPLPEAIPPDQHGGYSHLLRYPMRMYLACSCFEVFQSPTVCFCWRSLPDQKAESLAAPDRVLHIADKISGLTCWNNQKLLKRAMKGGCSERSPVARSPGFAIALRLPPESMDQPMTPGWVRYSAEYSSSGGLRGFHSSEQESYGDIQGLARSVVKARGRLQLWDDKSQWSLPVRFIISCAYVVKLSPFPSLKNNV